MDCLTAQRTLKLASADSVEISEPEVVDANSHVQSCEKCRTMIQFEEKLDKQIGGLCRDVEIPTGLKDRLLASLAAAAALDAERELAAGQPILDNRPLPTATISVPRRQTWKQLALATAACALVGVVALWVSRASTSTIEFDTISRLASNLSDKENPPDFTQFADGTEPRLPATMILPNSLKVAKPKLMEIDGEQVAVYFFSIKTKGRGNLQGKLVVARKSHVHKLPTATRFLDDPAVYISGFNQTAWVEGDLVFICFLTGDNDELSRLVLRPEVS